MLGLQELLAELNYDQSPFYRRNESDFEPEIVHLFRTAREINVEGGVDGIYVFETSPRSNNRILPAQPAVYVATANTEVDANEIHRSLWNLCYAPFLIVTLPHQIRIYTGFDYSPQFENVGLLERITTPDRLRLLKNFAALSVDSKQIWQSEYGKQLSPNQRVDQRLLRNLEQLGDVLKKHKLRPEVAHALIGKYVYFSYLRDRNILSNEWLNEQGIEPKDVFTYRATISSLHTLTKALEDCFNGQVFPIDFDSEKSLKDQHVSWVASVFTGDKVEETPEIVRQLHLPFQAYDFQYIPVEILSTIYEQFIHERKKKGAIYTPEILADYLLSEMEWARSLQRGMRVLDPACGSGVFLVLAYRRLIEKEMKQQGKRLQPEELRDILLESIHGIERELDACFVTEFSLILTLLHYVKPRELHKNRDFQFPALHNERIYHSDFFDPEASFSKLNFQFDWIVGNPPWVPADENEQPYARQWIQEHSATCPVGDYRVAEAFSWRAGELIRPDGLVGLLMPATSLVNVKSKAYRRQFFSKYEVLRITNFANLRDALFDRRGTFPANTLIYRNLNHKELPSPIIHYGPFALNQVSDGNKRPWVLTINENEIQIVDAEDAKGGETDTWKLALWGTRRDKRALDRFQYIFPFTLEEFCKAHGWGSKLPKEGAQLRDSETEEDVEYLAELENLKRFNSEKYNDLKIRPRFFIEPTTLETNDKYFLRLRGGKSGLQINKAPHIFLHPSWNFVVYSEQDFIIQPRQMGIAASGEDPKNKILLKALAAYLNSSLVSYYLFFQVPQWGFFSQRGSVVTSEVRKIPVPDFSLSQAEALTNLYDELVSLEKKEIERFVAQIRASAKSQLKIEGKQSNSNSVNVSDLPDRLSKSDEERVEAFSMQLETTLQDLLDSKLREILDLPEDLYVLSKEFIKTRLVLDTPSAINKIKAPPDQEELLDYARELREELDSFSMGAAHHRVTITYSNELIECEVEITSQPEPHPVSRNSIRPGDSRLLGELRDSLKEPISQWAYVQRGLRLFDGPRVYIYKPPRLIDWTRTEALQDASDIISSVLTPA